MVGTAIDTNVYEYYPAKEGVNIFSSPVEMKELEALETKNLVYKDGMVMRGGTTKVSANEVSAGKKITGLHRFYYGVGNKQTIVSSGTDVRYLVGSTWTAITTGQTTGLRTSMTTWGAVQKCYIANGTDALLSWDGSSSSALSGGNLPAKVIQVIPYQDRLLAIDDTNPGTLTWSASYDDTPANWLAASSTGVKPDSRLHGMVIHSAQVDNAGMEAKVLLAGDNGMYIFKGSDLRTPSTTGNYTIDTLSSTVGCNAPKTMAWTPQGTMYLGIDMMVYLIPFNSLSPIAVGWKIHSNMTQIKSIESLPSTEITDACGIYHDGYYKLSFPTASGGVNSTQYWLDMRRLRQDADGMYGPWYGPMTGLTINNFAVQGGNGDSGQLIGGEATAGTGSYVYFLNSSGVYSDNGTAIQTSYQSYYHPLGTTSQNKDISRAELELLNTTGTVTMDFVDIDRTLKGSESVGLSATAIYWGDSYWGVDYWSSSAPARVLMEFSPPLAPRRLSIVVKHTSSNDAFEWYGTKVEAKLRPNIFDTPF